MQVFRTSVAGRQPNTTVSTNSQYINAGGLALNMPDQILYTSNGSTLIVVGANAPSYSVSGGNVSINSAGVFVSNTTGVVNAAVHSVGTSFIANSTGITGTLLTVSQPNITANNANYLGGTAAASYQLNSTLASNVATLTANNTTYVNGKTEGNLNVNSATSATNANNAAYLSGYTWSAPAAIGGTTANTGTFSSATINGTLNVGASGTLGTGGQLQMAGYNSIGGTGYHTFLALENTYSSATNPYKYIRLNPAGGLEYINSAYNSVISQLTDGGGAFFLGGLSVGTSSVGGTGTIQATGNITAYYSDKRLKNIIGPIENAIDKVKRISGIRYTNNEVAKKYGYDDEKTQVGVIAQELEEVLPEVVVAAPFDIAEDGTSKSGENYKTVHYDKIVPLLIEAIKEQQAIIDDQNSKMNRMEQQLNGIMAKLEEK